MSEVQAAQETVSRTTDHDFDQQAGSDITESSTLDALSTQLQAMDESNEASRNQSATLEEQIDQQGESAVSGPLNEAADLNPTEMRDPPVYDPDLKPEQTGTDQSIDFSNTTQTSQSVVPSGVDLRSTDDVVNEMEEKLNEIGDNAELAEIDLQSALDKQQETIDMLSKMGEVQRETAETVVRKIALGQASAGDTTETGETMGKTRSSSRRETAKSISQASPQVKPRASFQI